MPIETKYDVFIIEGIDRLGKDVLTKNIKNALGHHFVLHFEKPEKLAFYGNDLQKYQEDSFDRGFALIDNCAHNFLYAPLIFNRFHLGETVYAPLYRGYSGDYVFDIEESYGAHTYDHVNFILLTTSDFSLIEDDGESFDFNNKEKEQEMFRSAFDKSIFPNKVIIDVSNGNGGWKSSADILKEALS